jgi:hypothetical protein
MNTFSMSITPKAIQEVLDELEASKQSRLRARSVLQDSAWFCRDGKRCDSSACSERHPEMLAPLCRLLRIDVLAAAEPENNALLL